MVSENVASRLQLRDFVPRFLYDHAEPLADVGRNHVGQADPREAPMPANFCGLEKTTPQRQLSSGTATGRLYGCPLKQ